MMLYKSYREDWSVFSGSIKGISRKYQGCFTKVSWNRKFQGCFRVFHGFWGSFQSVSRKVQENIQGLSKKFHVAWYSWQLPKQKEVLFLLVSLESVEHQGSFKDVSKKFESVSRMFQGCFKKDSRVFQGCFKAVSRKFQGCLKEPSRLFQESFKGISRKFKGFFKVVSMVF